MQTTQVSELMTTNVITLDKQQAIPLAQELMRMMHVRHLPVVGDDGELVGMVTHRSLLGAQVEMLSQIASDEDSERDLTVPVAKVMTTEVETVAADAPVADALRKMLKASQGVVVVVREEKVVGVLTSRDFLKLLLEQPAQGPLKADEIARMAAHEAVAQVTAKVARSSQPVAPRWLVWLLAALVVLLLLLLIIWRPPASGHAAWSTDGDVEQPATGSPGDDHARRAPQRSAGATRKSPAARDLQAQSSPAPTPSSTPRPSAMAPTKHRASGGHGPTAGEASTEHAGHDTPASDTLASETADANPIEPGDQLSLPFDQQSRDGPQSWVPEPVGPRR